MGRQSTGARVGRPSKGERVGYQLRLPEPLWRDLKYFVADRRSTMADEILAAVERYLKEERAKEQATP
jgi:hypothetical protein